MSTMIKELREAIK